MASVPLFLAADFFNRRLFNDIFFVRYKGESEDRLRAWPTSCSTPPSARRSSRAPTSSSTNRVSWGCGRCWSRARWTSRSGPLAKHLKIDDYVTNRLEFVDGYATGRLLPPMMAAATKASWMRIYAEKEKLNLSDCYGYSDSMSDLPMLSVVGHPTAVNPDLRLRNTALQHDWPILDLR